MNTKNETKMIKDAGTKKSVSDVWSILWENKKRTGKMANRKGWIILFFCEVIINFIKWWRF